MPYFGLTLHVFRCAYFLLFRGRFGQVAIYSFLAVQRLADWPGAGNTHSLLLIATHSGKVMVPDAQSIPDLLIDRFLERREVYWTEFA